MSQPERPGICRSAPRGDVRRPRARFRGLQHGYGVSGSWLVDGSLPIPDFKEAFRIQDLPEEAEGHFHTVGGLVMSALRRVPREGDAFETSRLRLEVVDMDGRRVDKVLVTRVGSPRDP